MNHAAGFVLACAAVVAAGQPSQAGRASAPTPAGIEASIRQRGAEQTISAPAVANQWDAVADRMSEGGSRWIALAPRLAPGADAGSAEDLCLSLAFSLPRNPGAVLAALDLGNGPVLGASRVCGMPFIEDTVKDRPAYRLRAIRAVAHVAVPALARARGECLAALRRAS